MRKLYPDVSQLIREHSQSEVQKKELEQVTSAFSAIPQVQASADFQQRLRANLLEQAQREKPGPVITFLRKIKPHYLSFGAVATIFLAVAAMAGPYYLDLAKVGEMASNQSSQAKAESTSLKSPGEVNEKLSSQEEARDLQNKAVNLDAAFQDSSTSEHIPEAALPQTANKQAKGAAAPSLEQGTQIQTFQAKDANNSQTEEPVQSKFLGPRSSVSRTGAAAKAIPGNLPKLPFPSQDQAAVKAEANSALGIKFELKAPFPKVSKEIWVYQSNSMPYSIEEQRALADKFMVPLPIVDKGEHYRIGDGQAYLEVSKLEGRFSYRNFVSLKAAAKISEAEALVLANKFIKDKGLALTEYDMKLLDLREKQLYQIRYIPLILGVQSPGQDVFIEISYNGSVRMFSYQRQIMGTANKYPIISPAEAWEQLKIEPIYGSAPNTVIAVNLFTLVYQETIQYNQKDTQTFLQPVYTFRGLDNRGNSFEYFLPAVKSEYFQQD